jgi:phosphatidylserine/phosphatidylglycerophosphate/cardiolipin synthase-like enzyme
MIALLLMACASPPYGDAFTAVDVQITDGPDATHAVFLDAIDAAETQLQVALPVGEDLAIADALIAAWDRGVEVEIVVDIDHKNDPAIDLMRESDLDVVLADHEVGYFDFSINDDVAWTSEQVRMTHAYVISDRVRVVQASTWGGLQAGPRVVFDARGEEVIDDLWNEHHQVFGGTDAAELTEYSSMAKSMTDTRWRYPTTTDVVLEVWFGPQERLEKRVIDGIYGARSSVWISTDDLTDEGLVHALQDKADLGFDVRVLVGAGFGSETPALSDLLVTDAPAVDRRQIPFELDNPVTTPTIVLIDVEPGRDGRLHQPRAMVLTHPLYSAARLFENASVSTDQYTDGSMWVLSDFDAASDELLVLRDLVDELHDQGVSL